MSKLPHSTPTPSSSELSDMKREGGGGGSDQDDNNNNTSVTWRDDIPGLIVLVVLYALQGLPLGLIFGSLPFYLSERLSLSEVAVFSFSSYPYSLKLFWSPIVDSKWIESIGRRKTWIIPLQFLMAITMIVISRTLDTWIQESRIYLMTVCFFWLIFLTATQDIAVDGWALTILRKQNTHLQSTCQSFGQTLGFAMTFPLFLALNSPDVCHKYLGFPVGQSLIQLDELMYYCGIVTAMVNFYVAVFVSEAPSFENDEEMSSELAKLTVVSAYRDMLNVIRNPNVLWLAVILFSCRLPFSAIDSAAQLRLNQKGYPKTIAGALIFINTPFDLLWPIVITSMLNRYQLQSLRVWKVGFTMRLCAALLSLSLVWNFTDESVLESPMFLAYNLLSLVMYSLCSSMMFTTQCMFFARIADPTIGGTYLTLVNTIANLGGMWPKYFVLRAIDLLSEYDEKSVMMDDTTGGSVQNGDDVPMTKKLVIVSDGFYIVCGILLTIGVFWILFFSPIIDRLQKKNQDEWSVRRVSKQE